MRIVGSRWVWRVRWVCSIVTILLLVAGVNAAGTDPLRLDISPKIPGEFSPIINLRDAKPLPMFSADSISGFNIDGLLYQIETEFDSTTGYYVSTRKLLGSPYGRPLVWDKAAYRAWRIAEERQMALSRSLRDAIYTPPQKSGGGALEIQVPFKIRSRTFRRIFGGDRVGLRVTGNIKIDGGLRREKSDQIQTRRSDQANYNFQIDQSQQFHIVGKVGDKVSVEIDQDSERLFDFENNVKLSYEGYEDEIIKSIEAGNVTLDLSGTQLATMTARNQGLFGFKTVSQVGPLSVTTIASLQKGEKNKQSYSGGSKETKYTFSDINFQEDQYFFLDEQYREQYKVFTEYYRHTADPTRTIKEIEVYRSVLRNDPTKDYFTGFAFYDPDRPLKVPDVAALTKQQIDDTVAFYSNMDELQTAQYGVFERLIENNDYEYQPDFGYIRLARPANGEIIAVAYRYGDGDSEVRVGTLNPEGQVILKQLSSKSPKTTDPNRFLAWKNVYNLGTGSVSYSALGLRMFRAGQNTETTPEGKTWLEVFGLDRLSTDGSRTPDGIIDSIWVVGNRAEIHFPDLRPFDPEGYTVGTNEIVSAVDTLFNPRIYDDEVRNSAQNLESYFKFEASYTSVSGDINLGINVLEGSEEVYANGRQLTKDVDYTIDYLSGRIVILDKTALTQGSQLEIKYESGELFQLDKRTMFGVRLEYALWEESFVGATFLHFNETPIEKRVKVGNEPLRNTIWDVNTRLKFKPYFMTQMVNALPLIDTDVPSSLSIEGEIAQVFPNPNSLNNESTGDDNGVAFIDDFEAARRTTSLGVRRKVWSPASHPVKIPFGDSRSFFSNVDYRGRLIWYNPYNQIPIKDIWPNREINSQVANSTDILVLQYDPTINNYRTNTAEPRSTWNGLMRYLNTGYQNQTTTRFIEVWMKWDGGGGDEASLYIDLGEISEDVIPDGKLNTEDKESEAGVRNDILDDGEDTGIDMMFGSDPPWRTGESITSDPWTVEEQNYDYTSGDYDWWDLDRDGEHTPDEPFSTDNWAYSQSSNDYEKINGTERNENDESRRPDTEDLNNTYEVEKVNNFFRYRFQLNDAGDYSRYVRGGQDNEKGWRLIRIPIDDIFDTVNNPSFSDIQFVRFWFGGATSRMTAQIAQIELVGNEWQESPVIDELTGDTTVYVSGSTINTHDNAEDYTPPPGVEGEIDPVTDLRAKEQSLVVQISDMPTASEGELVKYLTYRNQDLREYRQLKMYVHGGGRNKARLADKNLEMFLRFGSGLDNSVNRGYYEYSQKLNPGWEGNEIIIDLDRLSALKDKPSANRDGDITYEVLPNGDVMKVVGDPSLGRVQVYSIGVRNLGKPVLKAEEIEMWANELRLSEVRKESGMAMRSSVKATFADVMTLNGSLIQQDAEFHQVDQRTGRDYSNLETKFDAQFNLHRFFDPAWQISLPVHGSVSSSVNIPKYTQDNGDIRLTSLESGDISIWDKYGQVAFNQDHLEDRYLLDEGGKPVVDSTSGLLRQDLSKWGVDSLIAVNQTYSWGVNFNKSGKSGNWLLRHLLDPITWSVSHSQKYSNSIRQQYNKNFSSNGKINYSLAIQPEEIKLFKWAEDLPVLKSISDAKFNPLPSNLTANVNVSQSRGSTKNRNARELPKYTMNMNRGFGTSYSPFKPIRMDYSIAFEAGEIRADSIQQKIIYDDQPRAARNSYWAPGTLSKTIVDTAIIALREDLQFQPDGPLLADEAQDRLDAGQDYADVLPWLYNEINTQYPNNTLKQPWQRIESGSAEFDNRFFRVMGRTFALTRKNQSASLSVNPQLVSWLSTNASYRTNYVWNWDKTYAGRRMSTSNNISASMAFKLRQILPNPGGSSDATTSRRPRGQGRQLPKGGRDQTPPPDNKKPEEENPEAKAQPSPAELLKMLLENMRKLQDIRLDYSQAVSYGDPLMERGSPSLAYQLGLTGDPGVPRIVSGEAVGNDQVTRTDDYRLSSGIDWSSRISSNLDYSFRSSRNHTGEVSVNGSTQRSQFFWYNSTDGVLNSIDLPNYSLRWSGIEQIGPLSNFAQSITLNHTYRGSLTERWDERTVVTGEPRQKVISSRAYDKGYAPLAGMNITWKYGIGSQVNYNWNQQIDENVESGKLSRSSSQKITFSASYTRKSGFRIPLPIWPFKNRRFNNETVFSIDYEQSLTLDEVKLQDSNDFEETRRNSSWSLQPKINYKFSRTVTGAIHYRYGVNVSPTNTTRFQEFGLNVNISIRG